MRSGCGGCGGAPCGLCLRPRTVFYCELCVRRGDFVHSTTPFPDRFADKKLKLMQIKSYCKTIEERCNRSLEKRIKKENTILETDKCNERIRLLKLAVQQKSDNLKNHNAILYSLKEFNQQLSVKLPQYKSNVDTVHKYSTGKEKEIENRSRFLNEERSRLHALKLTRLRQLNKFIFPIKELNPQSQSHENVSSTERALADALRPLRNSENVAVLASLQILSASLPFDGDYSAYCNWVAVNKGSIGSAGGSANAEPASQNPAYRLSAALAYCAQMVRIMAFYLDVRLPCNVAYSDFCSGELEERKFRRSTLKLQSCAASLIGEVEMDGERRRRCLREPPLHALLRLCPPKPRRDFQENDADYFASELDDRENSEGDSWWARADGEPHSLRTIASDEEEPEPPEHLHWDAEAPESETASKQGLMTNAAASIVSIWRVFTK